MKELIDPQIVRPKYAWVSSHTARRSFCTNEYLAGKPGELIMAISGHKTEKAFRTYNKADNIQRRLKTNSFSNLSRNVPFLISVTGNTREIGSPACSNR